MYLNDHQLEFTDKKTDQDQGYSLASLTLCSEFIAIDNEGLYLNYRNVWPGLYSFILRKVRIISQKIVIALEYYEKWIIEYKLFYYFKNC